MRKEKLIFNGLLFIATMFGITACGDDDKENEIVPDPMETQKAYYIVGTVSDANGAVTGANVEVNNDIKTTTGSNGEYSLTVTEAKTYTVKFSANGLDSYEAEAVIASNAANRSQVALSVTLAKAIDFSEANTGNASQEEDVTIKEPVAEGEEEIAATVIIPASAAPENTSISVVKYEEPVVADNSAQAQNKEIEASIKNIAITTTPADAVAEKDFIISVPNFTASESEGYFDPAAMVATKEAVSTRAAQEIGDVKIEGNHYVITIPKGSSLAGKYAAKIKANVKASDAVAGEYNKVNGKAEVLRMENRDYAAMENVKLTVEVTNGWEYTTTPEAALEAANVSTELAKEIRKVITANEGNEKVFTSTLELTTSISGNHVVFYGNKAKIQNKTYTFKIVNKGGKNAEATVALKKYVGYTEEYTNAPISQHSGGTTTAGN